jgi:hypothetical protein
VNLVSIVLRPFSIIDFQLSFQILIIQFADKFLNPKTRTFYSSKKWKVAVKMDAEFMQITGASLEEGKSIPPLNLHCTWINSLMEVAVEKSAQFYLNACGNQLSQALETYYSANASQQKKPSAAANDQPSKPKITSFSQLKDSDAAKDDGEERQTYFAGGSEKSGVLMEGPPKAGKGKQPQELINQILDIAKKYFLKFTCAFWHRCTSNRFLRP